MSRFVDEEFGRMTGPIAGDSAMHDPRLVDAAEASLDDYGHMLEPGVYASFHDAAVEYGFGDADDEELFVRSLLARATNSGESSGNNKA